MYHRIGQLCRKTRVKSQRKINKPVNREKCMEKNEEKGGAERKKTE
jgi:hypothetical protein